MHILPLAPLRPCQPSPAGIPAVALSTTLLAAFGQQQQMNAGDGGDWSPLGLVQLARVACKVLAAKGNVNNSTLVAMGSRSRGKF